MKGYSFQELVKLAEAAVTRAGDTMTGNLTVPKVLLSATQGTEVNALTRKDYVDSEIAKRVSKSGDTMTGGLTIAPTSGVNAEVVLNSTTTTESSILFRNGGVTRWKFYQDNSAESGSNVGSDLLLRANADDGSTLGFVFDIQRESQIMSFVRNPRTNATQDTSVNALTRKDYVDGEIAKQVAKTGGTMTGNLTVPKVLLSATQGTEVNALTRKDYVDGEIAKQVSKSGDTMTGVLTVPYFRGLTSAQGSSGQNVAVSSEGSWVMMWRLNNQSGVKADEFIGIDSGSNLRFRKDQGLGNGLYTDHLVYHQGFKPTAADVGAVAKAGDTMTGNLTVPKVLLSATQGTEVNALTRKDYVDGEIAKQVSKSGDTMTGGLSFVNAASELGWNFNSDYAKIGFKNTADDDTDSYMWFKTGDNGNEYFKWQGVSGANTTDWMSLKPTGLVVAAAVTAPTFTGALVGNAATATKLATARQINGTNFDGSGNITTANWGTARTITIGNTAKSVDGSGNVSWTLAEIGAAPAGFGLGSYCASLAGNLNTVLRTQSGFYNADAADVTNEFQPSGWCYYMNMAHGNAAGYNGLLAMSFNGAHLGFKTVEGGADKGWNTIYHTGNKPTPADIGAVNKTGDTMTGDLTAPKVLVSGAQGTEVNALTRRDYVDAELSKKLSLTGGTVTGPLYIDQTLQSRALSVNDISSGARLTIVPQGSNERFTIDMYPANSSPYQVIEFRGSDRTTSFKQIVSCDVAPVAATHLTRKDYVDSQVATRAPTAHTHTAAQGNADIVASGYGQIGTYAMLKSLSSDNLGPGSTLAGTSLQYVSCSGKDNYSAPSPGGTWKCLGIANSYKNAEGSGATLWVRIA